MSKTNWQAVLEWMYENDVTLETANEYYDVDDIVDHPHLDSSEVSESLSVMDRYDLIEHMEIGDKTYIGLSKKGFSVAHERAIAKSQTRTSLAVAYLTAGLMFTGLLGAIVEAMTSIGEPWYLIYGWLTVGAAVVITIAYLVKRQGLFNQP